MNLSFLVVALVAAPFLVFSGSAKLVALGDAPRTLAALRIPLLWPRTALAAVSTGEIALGVLLLVTDGPLRVTVSATVCAAMLCFAMLVRRAVSRGATEDCGCFGRAASLPLSPALTRRNLVFAGAALLMTLFALVADVQRASSVVGMAQSAPLPLALLTAALAAMLGAVAAAARSGRAAPAVGALAEFPRPTLIRDDGLVVDVVQLALQGQAQLLLFSRPLCGACERAQASLDAARDALAPTVDARIVYAVGHGVDWNGPARSADGPRTPAAVDPGSLLARALDLGVDRPVAVLIGVDGRPVLPFAEGPDRVAALVEVLAASRTG